MDRPFPLHQDIFKATAPPIQVTPVLESDPAAVAQLALLLATLGDDAPLGLAGAYDKCRLVCVALAAPRDVVVVRLAGVGKKGKGKKTKQTVAATPGRRALAALLEDPRLKLGVHVDRLATALFLDHGLLLSGAVDIASLGTTKKRGGGALEQIVLGLGGQTVLGNAERVKRVFDSERATPQDIPLLALRAWACGHAGGRDGVEKAVAQAPRYNMDRLDIEEFAVLAKFKRDQDRLDSLKPTKVKNDVAPELGFKSGNLALTQTRFSTRMRPSPTQQIIVEYKPSPAPGGSAKKMQVTGRALHVNGKKAEVQLRGALPAQGTIAGVYTLGKEAPTNAEAARTALVRAALTRQNTILRGALAREIWLPGAQLQPAAQGVPAAPIPITWGSDRPLNASQEQAVRSILDNKPIALIHGGPGTGKTTVIAAAVMSLVAHDRTRTVWIVAQSNVAVKNVAEKLASCAFQDYRLLVSKDFHFDWHEHLYEQIEPKVIRSDNLPDNIVGTERALGGARVVLCTLSTLANSRAIQSGLMRIVPVQTVLVDEASQIEVGDYLPLVGRFANTLRKVVCIGDDKQLPPFGQEDIPDLQSVFELPHLRRNEVFLDTQYRMPTPLGQFISKHVYGSRLKSVHTIRDRSAVQFVDIPGEEKSQGHSWINLKEVQAVVHLARILQHAHRSLKIITPYDAQRTRLEDALKAAALKWEDTVFNVDSFQGNEADYILVSLVRTTKPGFLANDRRTNVLLSRCRRGMLVCASRRFVMGDERAQKTLVGKMAAEWAEAGCEWKSWKDLLKGRV